MPQYEYFCHACKRSFSKTLTPAEYEEGSYARTAATRRLPQVFVPRLSVIYDCATDLHQLMREYHREITRRTAQ